MEHRIDGEWVYCKGTPCVRSLVQNSIGTSLTKKLIDMNK